MINTCSSLTLHVTSFSICLPSLCLVNFSFVKKFLSHWLHEQNLKIWRFAWFRRSCCKICVALLKKNNVITVIFSLLTYFVHTALLLIVLIYLLILWTSFFYDKSIFITYGLRHIYRYSGCIRLICE